MALMSTRAREIALLTYDDICVTVDSTRPLMPGSPPTLVEVVRARPAPTVPILRDPFYAWIDHHLDTAERFHFDEVQIDDCEGLVKDLLFIYSVQNGTELIRLAQHIIATYKQQTHHQLIRAVVEAAKVVSETLLGEDVTLAPVKQPDKFESVGHVVRAFHECVNRYLATVNKTPTVSGQRTMVMAPNVVAFGFVLADKLVYPMEIVQGRMSAYFEFPPIVSEKMAEIPTDELYTITHQNNHIVLAPSFPDEIRADAMDLDKSMRLSAALCLTANLDMRYGNVPLVQTIGNRDVQVGVDACKMVNRMEVAAYFLWPYAMTVTGSTRRHRKSPEWNSVRRMSFLATMAASLNGPDLLWMDERLVAALPTSDMPVLALEKNYHQLVDGVRPDLSFTSTSPVPDATTYLKLVLSRFNHDIRTWYLTELYEGGRYEAVDHLHPMLDGAHEYSTMAMSSDFDPHKEQFRTTLFRAIKPRAHIGKAIYNKLRKQFIDEKKPMALVDENDKPLLPSPAYEFLCASRRCAEPTNMPISELLDE